MGFELLFPQLKSIIPGRCVLFLNDAFTGGPIASVPAGLRAHFQIVCPPSDFKIQRHIPSFATASSSGDTTDNEADYLRGVLTTDYVGYALWDLVPLLRRLQLLVDWITSLEEEAFPYVELDSLTIRLAGPLATEIEVFDPAQLGSDAFVKRLTPLVTGDSYLYRQERV
jgi:hypothetical protein